MKTLAQYLHLILTENQALDLLKCYPKNEQVRSLLKMCPDADIWNKLAQALFSGQSPVIPKTQPVTQASPHWPAIEEQD